MPVPIAKKTINGINLYCTIMKEENPQIKGDDKSMPNIKNIIESACTIPLLDAWNNPKASGSMKSKTNPSNLKDEYNEANPSQKS